MRSIVLEEAVIKGGGMAMSNSDFINARGAIRVNTVYASFFSFFFIHLFFFFLFFLFFFFFFLDLHLKRTNLFFSEREGFSSERYFARVLPLNGFLMLPHISFFVVVIELVIVDVVLVVVPLSLQLFSSAPPTLMLYFFIVVSVIDVYVFTIVIVICI